MMPHDITEGEIRQSEAFLPYQGTDFWQEGQTAYLDWFEKAHIGNDVELYQIIKNDLQNVTDPIHHHCLAATLKEYS